MGVKGLSVEAHGRLILLKDGVKNVFIMALHVLLDLFTTMSQV